MLYKYILYKGYYIQILYNLKYILLHMLLVSIFMVEYDKTLYYEAESLI